jgi:hypothetical protein
MTKLQFIPRYINYSGGKTKTLQDLGWNINLEMKKTHLVHYCENCQCQRCFTVVSELTKVSKNTGRNYVCGYRGFCIYCNGRVI